jgi:hypothetical protein
MASNRGSPCRIRRGLLLFGALDGRLWMGGSDWMTMTEHNFDQLEHLRARLLAVALFTNQTRATTFLASNAHAFGNPIGRRWLSSDSGQLWLSSRIGGRASMRLSL